MTQIIAKIIKDATIKDINIAALTITNGKFADTTINSDQYASNSIDGEKLSAQCQTDILDSKAFTFQSKVENITAGASNTLNITSVLYDVLTKKSMCKVVENYYGIVSETALSDLALEVIVKNHASGDPIDDGSNNQVFGQILTSKILGGTLIVTQGSPIITGTFADGTYPVGTILSVTNPVNYIYKVIAQEANQITIDRGYEGSTPSPSSYIVTFTLSFYKYINGVRTAHTMSNQSIDFYPYERAALSVIPKDALQTILEGYPEILPLNHNHTVFTLSSDLESTSTGKGADLFGLNGGSQSNLGAEIRAVSDVTRLDTRYYTEAELSNTGTGTSGAAKIGYDTGSGASTVQSQIDSINTDASGLYTEHTEK
ncbi:MAG: hypothetical protein KKD01_19845, partial [Proteobacteria bacterium]|nr:hypothetical protein [Pseudomonadota bacterium]